MKINGLIKILWGFTPLVADTGQFLSVRYIPFSVVTPTKGSIGILTEEGDLFAGDTLVNSKKPDMAVFVNDSQELKNSIEKLGKLNIKKVYPGHGKTFSFSDLNIKDGSK